MLARALFHQHLVTRAVIGGLVAAVLPAGLLAIAVGGPLGGALGRQVFRELGLPTSGDMFGVAAGVALVFALAVVAGGALGLGVGRLLKR